MSKRPVGRPKTRMEDDGLADIKNMNVCNWKKVTQNRDIERVGRKWLSKPEPYIGCSALEEEEGGGGGGEGGGEEGGRGGEGGGGER
jgi:hypothetical protein